MSAVGRVLDAVQCIADTFIRIIGPLFVVAAISLTSGVIYVWAVALLPMHASSLWSASGIFHLVIATWLASNLGYNYVQTILTAPGSPSADAVGEVPEVKEVPRGEGFSTYCKKCKATKPVRSHHCHVCRKCVLRMDHHCPWVHNCVGYFNHRYFFLFLLYMWLGCAYIGMMASSPFANESWGRPWRYPVSRSTVMFAFVLALSIFLAMTVMMFWHLYLILTAQTTIEFYFNRFKKKQAIQRGEVYRNEFDLGVKRNLDVFFGYRGRWWMVFFPYADPPPGDGITYPRFEDTLEHWT